ncbi:ROK family transcriptional regulator [Tsukamurella sp. 8F]|uniref:ROK family transcriptional regulator n=1 Tax=unclassified Tsukamurella TaxID=2633480 RepID=UPI0023B9F4D4|nr:MULTISPECIES: ROK family transcriptional regulator [unclassified Tsukamurella]MDF0531484.1 ROK family transcriptional regulator [Tsukamurella sp. 8J]MDF0588728.1 ROK family transcriptional regulator [Tsukamurella sp. 8F]
MTVIDTRPVRPSVRSTRPARTLDQLRSAEQRTSEPRPAAAPRVFAPQLRVADKPAAAVLRVIRRGGLVLRDEIVRETQFSAATVNRQVTALIEAGVVRERADRAASGVVGRPRLPLEIDPEGPLGLGIHIGYRVTAITMHDVAGKVVGAIQIPTPASSDPGEVLAVVAASARRFLTRFPGRTLLGAGVAIGGRVDENGVVVDHPRLKWSGVALGERLSGAIGLPVTVAPHVEAMAAAELHLSPELESQGSTLYFYGRETVGVALALHGAVHAPKSGPHTIGHLPIRNAELLDRGRTGRLEDAVTDTAFVDAAVAAGIVAHTPADVYKLAQQGDANANALIAERGRLLGEAVALVADIFNPDRVILGGQAFTDYPAILPYVSTALKETSAEPSREVRVTGAAARVQQQAAGAVALDGVYTDPIAAVARAIA